MDVGVRVQGAVREVSPEVFDAQGVWAGVWVCMGEGVDGVPVLEK